VRSGHSAGAGQGPLQALKLVAAAVVAVVVVAVVVAAAPPATAVAVVAVAVVADVVTAVLAAVIAVVAAAAVVVVVVACFDVNGRASMRAEHAAGAWQCVYCKQLHTCSCICCCHQRLDFGFCGIATPEQPVLPGVELVPSGDLPLEMCC